MTGEQHEFSQTKCGTNGVPNKGSVGGGAIYLKEGLYHSKWDGWAVCHSFIPVVAVSIVSSGVIVFLHSWFIEIYSDLGISIIIHR